MESGVCRICLREGAAPLATPLSEAVLTDNIPEIIHKIRGPLSLCNECVATLTSFLELRRTAQIVGQQIERYILKTGVDIVDLREMKEKRFACDACSVCFSEATLYDAHLLTHSIEKRFQCKECKKCFCTSNNLQKHYKCVHGKLMENFCSQTNIPEPVVKLNGNLPLTVNGDDSSEMYQCSVCHRKFQTEQIMKEHKSRAHSEKGKHVCRKCRKAFSSVRSKQRHLLACLELANEFICYKCEKAFSSNWNLKRHFRLHDQVPKVKQRIMNCKPCNLIFDSSEAIVEHLKEKHCGSHFCPICYMIFAQKYNKKRHLMRSHSAEEREQLLNGEEKEPT